jgi:mannose-6-phosphate isomerase-like protein (cupin superfamily)
MTKTEYEKVQPYVTKDGSVIRELMHPGVHGDGDSTLSLAEATVPPGSETFLHRHRDSEEIYHITEGTGNMVLGGERFKVTMGDTILIPRCIPHKIENTEKTPLKLLCCCSPPYSHDDTELILE